MADAANIHLDAQEQARQHAITSRLDRLQQPAVDAPESEPRGRAAGLGM